MLFWHTLQDRNYADWLTGYAGVCRAGMRRVFKRLASLLTVQNKLLNNAAFVIFLNDDGAVRTRGSFTTARAQRSGIIRIYRKSQSALLF